MKCSKARELVLIKRDGTLDGKQRSELEEHLATCKSCAEFAGEVEVCLSLLNELPELEPSPGFEWNVKRRIHAERDRQLGRAGRTLRGERNWAGWFMAGAAIAASAVLIYAFASFRVTSRVEPSVRAVSGSKDIYQRPAAVVRGNPFLEPGFVSNFTAPRLVSDRALHLTGANDSSVPRAFNFIATAREDSLMHENEMLKRRIEYLQRRIIYLQATLENNHGRDNFSLP